MRSRSGITRALSHLREAEAELVLELDRVRTVLTTLASMVQRPIAAHAPAGAKVRRTMSAAGRAAISRAARKRWAKWRKENGR
jgi:hypothetical protein